jgi:signal transduction histidine kinase
MWYSLRFRLISLLTVLLILAFAGMMVFNVNVHTRQLVRQAGQSSEMISLTVEKSLRHAMLQNHRADITAILSAVGELPKIKRIVILGNHGEVLSPSYAHRLSPAIGKLKFSPSPVSFAIPGDRYRTINAIENDRPCMGCHGTAKKAVGYLVIDRSIRDIRQARDADRRQILLVGILTLVIISVAVQLALSTLVLGPVSSLMGTMSRIVKGEQSARASERARGEFGTLARTFNGMLEDLEAKNTEIVQTHDRLSQAERLASIGLLAAGVAHQIGNPLATISISAEALGETPDAGQNRFIRAILGACKTISGIVTELLNFDRLRAIDVAEVSVSEMIDDAISTCLSLAASGQTIESKVDSDLRVSCDARQMRGALVNVIANAVQAMPAGGKVTVSAVASDANVVIDVADTGPGIPEDLLDRIFEPFSTTKDVGEGSGLGLAIAREVVRRHSGEITARNRPEGGALIQLRIPLILPGYRR